MKLYVVRKIGRWQELWVCELKSNGDLLQIQEFDTAQDANNFAWMLNNRELEAHKASQNRTYNKNINIKKKKS